MLIDWFTVGAQALNFVILVWLMKRFLYGPILRAIAARDARVAADLSEAKSTKDEAARERDGFRQKHAVFEQERAALLSQARAEAEAEGQRLLAAATQAADELSARRRAARDDEARQLQKTLAQRVQREVFAIARKTLADLADSELEERMTAAFVRRLGDLDDDAIHDLAREVREAQAPPLIRSAFDLPAASRATLQAALDELVGAEVPLRFETAPDSVCGIALTTDGLKLAWSIDDQLQSLARGVQDVVRPDVDSSPAAAAHAPPAGHES